ncbi:MAG: hypothetical protein O3A37_14745 [Planctomycetota bacterium]|jgi:hypothetical protein|nr:hypothetical protein [Planctomycetota bacterium]
MHSWIARSDRFRSTQLVVAMVAVCFLQACNRGAGSGGVSVSGRVLSNGQPLPLDERLAAASAAYVQIGFQRLGADGVAEGGDGTVVVASPDGAFTARGLPAGRYRVSVQHNDGTTEDALGGRFGPTNSPLEIEVGQTPLEQHVIDVGAER